MVPAHAFVCVCLFSCSDSDTLAEFQRKRKNNMELVDLTQDGMHFNEGGLSRRGTAPHGIKFSKWLWLTRPWLVRGDADGLFAHLLNTIITLMLIVQVSRVRTIGR